MPYQCIENDVNISSAVQNNSLFFSVSDVSALSVTPVNDFHGIWMMKRNQSTVRSAFYNLDYCVQFLLYLYSPLLFMLDCECQETRES